MILKINKLLISISVIFGVLLMMTTACEKETSPPDTLPEDEIVFDSIVYDSITDSEGNVYRTIDIGTQTWMADNLRVTKYRNGDIIETTTPTTELSEDMDLNFQWTYDRNEENVSIYDRLYTWYAINDSRNISPEGWHVATDDEWMILIDYLIENGYGYEGGGSTDIGKSLATTFDWNLSSTSGDVGKDLATNNKSGFNGPPGGYFALSSGTSEELGNVCIWWSSTALDVQGAWGRSIEYNYSTVDRGIYYKFSGLSVRCVKD